MTPDQKKKVIYTPSQEAAINAEDGDILVSAAAGSGKTMVLTHRIMRGICRRDEPELLGDLLIVTFTKAAAAELVEKIADLLREKIRDMQDEEIKDRLKRELLHISGAKISTIHSYCLDLIREHYAKLDLPGNFRTAEDKEADFLLLEVCKNVVDSFYEEERCSERHDFSYFCSVFYPLRDDKIEPDLAERYKKLLNYAEGIDYLNESVLMKKDTNAVISFCRETILRKFSHLISHFKNILSDALLYVNGDPAMQKARSACLSSYLSELERCKNALVSGWDEVGKCLSSLSFGKAGTLKSELKTPELAYFDKQRQKCKEKLDGFRDTYFSKIGGDPFCDVEKTRALVLTLVRVLKRIDEKFAEEKRRRAMIDFSDMERMTLKLLENPAIREAQQRRFKRIYIDEYQDVNPLQDRIFSSISRENRFMVGDIKQSIYGFRGAAPDLFAGYRAAFPDHINNIPQTKARVFLSDNFRCDESVVRFSNAVFGKLFPAGSGIVDYIPEKDKLVYKKKPEKDLHLPVEIHLFTHENEEDGIRKQAAYTAQRIRLLLTAGNKPEEIAILLRSTKKTAKVFSDALDDLGIPCTGGTQTAFFNKRHILLTLSMLRVIDNPRTDVSLAAVLKSPVFGIDADTLLQISGCPGKTLYEKLLCFNGAENDPRTAGFLIWLADMRSMQKSAASHTIIRTLYEETDLCAAAAADGAFDNGLSDFDLLYDMARRFEANSFRGLHAFLHYVGLLIESDEIIDPEGDDSVQNAVHIMSIHHSKGLEFPVCFVCNLEKGTNLMDLRGDIIDDERFGFALRLRDETGLVKYDTLLRCSQTCSLEEKLTDEEARLLYVALTRAQNRLILLGSCRHPEETIEASGMSCAYFDNYACLDAPSFMNWILACPEALKECTLSVHDGDSFTADVPPAAAPDAENDLRDMVKQTASQILDRVERTEKRLTALKEGNALPTKLSVSTLKPDLFDGTEGELPEDSEKAADASEIPRFLLGKKTPTAAEKGTATHLFMQFCNFERVEKYGVAAEIAALVSENFIEKETAELIERKRLEGFFSGKLFREMRDAGKLWREQRFNVLFDAGTFTSDDDQKASLAGKKVLVQGVADCFFIDRTGGICLVDYKTDHFGNGLSEAEIRKELVSRYETQLRYYAEACREIIGLPVHRAVLWSFALNDTVEVHV